MTFKKLVPAAVTAGALALAPAAQATTETVTGTTQDSLSVGISTAATAMTTNFTPGKTATTSGVLTVTATGAWYLKAVDSSATTPGYMDKLVDLTCTTSDGDASLTNALSITGTPTAGTSAGAKSLSGTVTTLANGSLSDTVTMSYSQSIPSTQKMKTGCVYSVPATYSVTSTA